MTSARPSMQDNNVSCVIIGNAGFLGYGLAQQLLDQNCSVTCVDFVNPQNQLAIQNLKKNPAFTFVTQKTFGDIE